MISLPIKPKCCPCGSEWIRDKNNFWSSYWMTYVCSTKCPFMFLNGSINGRTNNFFLCKKFSKKLEVWWRSNDTNTILATKSDSLYNYHGAQDRSGQELNVVLPFNISEERVRLLIMLG